MIKANFNTSAIKAKLNAFREKMIRDTIQVLDILGEMAVNEAKDNGAYLDQTSNLRSSIGYVVVVNGQIVREAFEASGSGKIEVSFSSLKTRKVHTTKISGGQTGVSTGQAVARALASKHNTGFALVVVAGMNYALYVEANGLNVLTSAEQLAKRKLPKLLEQIKRNANNFK